MQLTLYSFKGPPVKEHVCFVTNPTGRGRLEKVNKLFSTIMRSNLEGRNLPLVTVVMNGGLLPPQ